MAVEPPHQVRWLELDGELRRRVARTARKGAAVGDPRDAAYAVGYVDATLEWLSTRGRLRPFHLLLALVVVFELIATWTWPLAALLYPLLGFGFLRLRTPALRRRLTGAREANAELAREWGLPPVQVLMPGYAWLHPGSRRRRRLVVALTVVLVAVLANLTVGGTGRRERTECAPTKLPSSRGFAGSGWVLGNRSGGGSRSSGRRWSRSETSPPTTGARVSSGS
jgi:hypothetical protein